MPEIIGEQTDSSLESEFYEVGDYLLKNHRLYFISAVGGLMERNLGIGEVVYSGKEYEFKQKRGLLISEWKETHGNIIRRNYVQIDDSTAIDRIEDWKLKETEINSRARYRFYY